MMVKLATSAAAETTFSGHRIKEKSGEGVKQRKHPLLNDKSKQTFKNSNL